VRDREAGEGGRQAGDVDAPARQLDPAGLDAAAVASQAGPAEGGRGASAQEGPPSDAPREAQKGWPSSPIAASACPAARSGPITSASRSGT
jgi:hypothetical protein